MSSRNGCVRGAWYEGLTCAGCAGTSFVRTSSEEVCDSCGLVLPGGVFDYTPETRTHADTMGVARDGSRYGGPLFSDVSDDPRGLALSTHNLPANLASAAGKANRDAIGNGRVTPSHIARGMLETHGQKLEALNLTDDVRDEVRDMFAEVMTAKTCNGGRRLAVFTACVYLATYSCGKPKTTRDISTHFGEVAGFSSASNFVLRTLIVHARWQEKLKFADTMQDAEVLARMTRITHGATVDGKERQDIIHRSGAILAALQKTSSASRPHRDARGSSSHAMHAKAVCAASRQVQGGRAPSMDDVAIACTGAFQVRPAMPVAKKARGRV